MKELLLERKGKFILYLIACLIPVIIELAQIGVLALIFEAVGNKSMEALKIAGFSALGVAVLGGVLFILGRLMRISFMRDVLLTLRIRAFDKIINMSYKQFNKKSRDVYVSNLINDVNTFESNFFLALINVIFRVFMYASALAILIVINWKVASLIFMVSILVLLISKFFEKRTVRYQKEVSSANEKFTVDVSNIFNGLEILKLNNIENTFLGKNKTAIKSLEHKKFKYNIFTSFQLYSNLTIGYFVILGLVVYMIYQTQNGLGYGIMIISVQLSSNIIFSLVNMFPLVNRLKASTAIFKKITIPEEVVELDESKNSFEFKKLFNINDVSFSYENNKVFKSMSFSFEKGKKHIIKGPSGSGKSTLFKLVSHILDDYKGSIDIDGVDLKTISISSFNEKVSYVYQDVFLFETTLKENISLYKDYSDEEVIEACNKAGLKDFVESLDEGINTMISENGKNLSGGERQRISIARALCKNAEIIFVDEATSALNDELGRQIESTLLSLDATVITISHKHFEGITNKYDTVFEIKDGFMTTYKGKDYFEEVLV
ncbi:ABC transporter ATP-binding protein [Mycoplasmatota bacterium WC30]